MAKHTGTFIYHTHVDEVRQKQAGLTDPLIVVDDPARYDPEHDLVMLVTVPRKGGEAAKVLLNGSLSQVPCEMHVCQHYRLRLINAHINRPGMWMRMRRDTDILTWRAVLRSGERWQGPTAGSGDRAVGRGSDGKWRDI